MTPVKRNCEMMDAVLNNYGPRLTFDDKEINSRSIQDENSDVDRSPE